MAGRTTYIQIRVTPEEKATLRRLAQSSGQDLSGYVLSRALPASQLRFHEILRLLGDEAGARYALAELNDLLSSLAPAELPDVIQHADVSALSTYLMNYVAAMVEHACGLKRVSTPSWIQSVPPLEAPHFASPLKSHRLHLLRASPVPFKKRNIFVDASVGARV